MPWSKVDPIALPLQRVLDAAIPAAIDDTTAAAAIEAKRNHGWQNRTGTAEGSIRFDPATKVGPGRWRGVFGSFDVMYFIFLELGHFVASARGFQYRGGHPERAFARFIKGDHTLRRAADVEFPKIGARLRARMAGIGSVRRTR